MATPCFRQTESSFSSAPSNAPTVRLQLFVNGQGADAQTIVQRIDSLFSSMELADYQLEVYDIREAPELLEQENILVLPTLIKQSPKPGRRLIGDMAREDIIKEHLGLPEH